MNSTFAALLFLLSTAPAMVADRVLATPRFTFTGEEQARLVQILRDRPATEWRTVDRPEIQRKRMTALREALVAMRDPADREPLGLVAGWWRVLRKVRTYPPQTELAGRLVSRPFSGYHIRVPRAYRADRPAPLVICLHRGGSRRGKACIEKRWGHPSLRDEAIVFAPDWPHGEGAPRWSHRRYLHLTFGVLGDVLFNDFNIDRNRIFLDGGAEAWRLAASFAHLFAGVIIRGEAPPGLIDPDGGVDDGPFPLGNLKNLNLLYVREGEDGGPRSLADLRTTFGENTRRYRIVGRPRSIVGGPAPDRDDEIRRLAVANFVAKSHRHPYPTFIEWTVLGRHASRAYWVRSLDEAESALEGNPAPPRFQVTRDRKANSIDIDAHRIRGFEISLNDAILDLGRPITITVNGARVFHGRAERSLARALRSVARSGDWTDVFPWVTRVEIAARQ